MLAREKMSDVMLERETLRRKKSRSLQREKGEWGQSAYGIPVRNGGGRTVGHETEETEH